MTGALVPALAVPLQVDARSADNWDEGIRIIWQSHG